MALAQEVKIVEVGPRDGLQNEAKLVPTATKIEFINQLSTTGLQVIEATSFVSPKWVPQLADAKEVYTAIEKKPGVAYPVLVPNITGLNQALAAGVREIAVFSTPSEEFSRHNTNCSVAESLARIAEVTEHAKRQHLRIRGYISCVLGCPYEGEISPQKVVAVAEKLIALGCDEISLGDTIGVGTPTKTQNLIAVVAEKIPLKQLAVHFHDTYGQALVNIYAALMSGISIVDSAISGLGGCPYAKGATGNVATEDVVYMLNGMGINTGVDLTKLIATGEFICHHLQRATQSKVARALLSIH